LIAALRYFKNAKCKINYKKEKEKERETVVRVGENSSVSVDVIAGFDVLSINSVPNQTHSSFILCNTHTLRSTNTVCTILVYYNKLKKKKCHYYRIGLDWIPLK
jgi:hypothetical protein